MNREAFWVLQTIDPTTGLPPSNVFLGLLPVNDETNKGTGFVQYSIKPLATDVTGDSITAKAFIVFDENEPVETNTWANIVDAVAPTSSLSGLPQSTGQLALPISYSGVDDVGGSGLRSVNLYVSVNNAAPALWVQNFTGTDTVYVGEKGKTYKFYGSAVDNVGNREPLALIGTVSISNQDCIGNDFVFTSNLSGTTYQWQVNTGSGFVNLANGGMYEGVNDRTLHIIHSQGNIAGNQYRCLVNGSAYSQTFNVHFVSTWEGTVNTDWNNAENWSCGVVPNENTDVVIPTDKPRYPLVNTLSKVRTLVVFTGAAVTVKAGSELKVMR